MSWTPGFWFEFGEKGTAYMWTSTVNNILCWKGWHFLITIPYGLVHWPAEGASLQHGLKAPERCLCSHSFYNLCRIPEYSMHYSPILAAFQKIPKRLKWNMTEILYVHSFSQCNILSKSTRLTLEIEQKSTRAIYWVEKMSL